MTVPVLTWRARNRRGRHRLGRSGLSHCRAIPEVERRLASRSSALRAPVAAPASVSRGLAARRCAMAAALSALATVVVSGWYAAAGASAIVQMVAH